MFVHRVQSPRSLALLGSGRRVGVAFLWELLLVAFWVSF